VPQRPRQGTQVIAAALADTERGRVQGVRLADGELLECPQVVAAGGTSCPSLARLYTGIAPQVLISQVI
jgi:hypothetical protein